MNRRRRDWLVVLGAVVVGGSFVASRVQAAAPKGQFTDHLDGTVTDNRTKLLWQRDMQANPLSSWSDAKTHCTDLFLKGKGWRLPNVKELQTILDRTTGVSPAVDLIFFGDTIGSWHWTATQATAPTAWAVDFGQGAVMPLTATDKSYYRCVHSP